MRLTVDKMYKEKKSYPVGGSFAELSESDRRLVELFAQRSVDIYGPILGHEQVGARFHRRFTEESLKVWADLSTEEKAFQLKQFDDDLQIEAREVSAEVMVQEAVNDDSGAVDEEALLSVSAKAKPKRQRSRAPAVANDIPEEDEDFEDELAFFDELGPLDEEPIEDGPSIEGFLIRGHRPRTRSECPPYRPCPYVTCRYHLYLDVTRRGRMRYNFPDIDVTNLDMSCALDLAERGPRTLEEIGSIMGGISRERVRQIEQAALNLLRMRGGRALAEFLEDREAPPPPNRPAKKSPSPAGARSKKAEDDAEEA